jgi:alkanesulfonate monooxygenase SsuD/methylene tetrahydromethanopterin reductase-like flavin-dependent oxidoreductase (luciferase family)
MSAPRPLLLAVELDGDGAHPAAWRHSGRPPGHVLTGAAVRQTVTDAETAGFVLATFADTPLPPTAGTDGLEAAGRVEAGTRAAFVAAVTDRIGLAPTLHATTTEPFHLATQLASLDHASRGRAGWVIGAATDAESLATVGRPALGPADLRQELADVIDTARLLWDSWQDDAVIKDIASGRYLDPDRVHHIDFTGATFAIKGPLITPRPPQGQIVVVAPDHLDIDERADIVLVAAGDLALIASRAARAREAGAPLVFAEIEVVLDTPTEPATARLAALDDTTPWSATRRLRHVGTAADLLDLLVELADSVDGVRILPAVQRADLPAFIEHVRPALTAAGRYRAPQAGDTLRTNLGLTRPTNRFVTTGR